MATCNVSLKIYGEKEGNDLFKSKNVSLLFRSFINDKTSEKKRKRNICAFK